MIKIMDLKILFAQMSLILWMNQFLPFSILFAFLFTKADQISPLPDAEFLLTLAVIHKLHMLLALHTSNCGYSTLFFLFSSTKSSVFQPLLLKNKSADDLRFHVSTLKNSHCRQVRSDLIDWCSTCPSALVDHPFKISPSSTVFSSFWQAAPIPSTDWRQILH